MFAAPLSPPASPYIVACVKDHSKAIMLLRAAHKRAQEKKCAWKVVFIETPSSQEDSNQERMLHLLTLAEQMGGEALHLEAESVEKGLESLLEREGSHISLVMIGSTGTTKRFGRRGAYPWMHLVRIASRYTQVEVVPLAGNEYRKNLVESLQLGAVNPLYVVYALFAVGVATLSAFALQELLPPALFRINDQNIGLLFMIACAFSAGRYGLLPGLVASVASFFTVNYFFTLPYYTLKLDMVTDILNMILFLSAALFISLFTSQTRDYAQKSAKRELSTQALFTLYRIASEAFTREQALQKLQQKLEHMLELHVAFFLPTSIDKKQVEPAFPADLALEEGDRKALDACWLEMKTTGLASPFNPGTQWRFEPMISPAGEMGVLGIKERGKTRMDAWFGRLMTAIADQTATVMEHIDLEHSMQETRLSQERESLRSMLLSSISHDFKTPLAGIIGALSVHRSLGDRLTQEKRTELIESAIEEAQRLDSFITNILDMTRLESGNIRFRKEWHDMESMVKNVTVRLRHRLRQHDLHVQPSGEEIEVFMDVMMTEQVLQNLLDNACKYSPPGTRIDLSYSTQEEGMICEIRDHGGGLPPEKLAQVFDKYARLHKKDTQVAGTGLGLAISKAIMEAQGGWIIATNHPEGGALFRLCLPQWRKTEPLHIKAGANA